LNKQSVVKKHLQCEYHCYATTENRVSREVIQHNAVTRLKNKVFITWAERIYLRWTDIGALTHTETDSHTG
jgi:hypothetical protein